MVMPTIQSTAALDRFWYQFFEGDARADHFADTIRISAIESRFSRPDWNILLTPMVIDADELDALHQQLVALRTLLTSIEGRLFAGRRADFLRTLGVPYDAAAALDLPHAGLLPCRWDVLPTADGWRTVELNATGALGVFAVDHVQSVYDTILAEAGLIEAGVAAANRESWTSLSRVTRPLIAAMIETYDIVAIHVVLDSHSAPEYRSIALGVADMLRACSGQDVCISDETEMAALVASGAYPLLAYPCSSIADRHIMPERYTAYDRAVRDGAIVQAIDPVADIVANKAMLALAWECLDKGLLSTEEASLLQNLVPRTVFVRDAEHERAISGRADWVCKQVIGHGGYQVHCGWEMSDNAWSALLASETRSSAPGAILQRRVVGRTSDGIGVTPVGDFIFMQAPLLLGLFQQQDRFSGACARQSPHNGGVVSVGAGAALGVVRSSHAQPVL